MKKFWFVAMVIMAGVIASYMQIAFGLNFIDHTLKMSAFVVLLMVFQICAQFSTSDWG